MGVLVWGNGTEEITNRLRAALRRGKWRGGVSNTASVSVLRETLLEHREAIDVLILAPESPGELAPLLEHRGLLSETRIVVLLPDDSVETVMMAHQLLPRYASARDVDAQDLAAVVLNLLHQRDRRQANGVARSVPLAKG